jgi:glycosyltransferase involved in cell wall biosynthesis
VNRPVPVLFLIHSLGHGGSERQLAGYARNIDRKLFTPHVASIVGGFRAEEMQAEGIPVIQLPLRGLFAPNILRVARALRKYIRENKIRIVHAFDYGPSLFGVAVGRSSGVIALSSQRFYMDSVPPKYQVAVLASHWLGHGVVTNSEGLKRYVHDKLKYPTSRIDVCPNGLNTQVFCPEPREHSVDAPVIGTVCVLRREKNLGQLIEAFSQIRARSPGAKLLIVGSGPEESNLKAAGAHLGLADSATFLPSVSDVTRAMRNIDIFVHPSLSEGMPNAVMEAMACGCAVVASRVGGTPDLIEHGVHGLLVQPGDAVGLAEQMAALIDQPELRLRIAKAGSERIRTEFSIEASCRRLESIYQGYLSRREPASRS